MNTVIRYFKHHSRTSLIRFAIITFICLLVVTLAAQGINETYRSYTEYAARDPYYEYDWSIDPGLPLFVVITVILCTALPMIELSPFNSRRYLDSAFSFPISRPAMVSVNLINGFLQFLLPYTIAFIWYAIMISPCSDRFSFGPIWDFFLISILYGLFLYAFNAFFFSLCNSTADGAIIAISWQHILCPLALTYTEMFGIKWYDQMLFIVWYPFGVMSDYCSDLARGKSVKPNLHTNNNYAMLICLIVITVLSVLFIAGTVYFFSRKRAESAGEISDTPAGYKVLIPVTTGMLIYWALEAGGGIISLLALIFATVSYIIYRRGVKLKAFDIIVIAACFVCFLMGVLA